MPESPGEVRGLATEDTRGVRLASHPPRVYLRFFAHPAGALVRPPRGEALPAHHEDLRGVARESLAAALGEHVVPPLLIPYTPSPHR